MGIKIIGTALAALIIIGGGWYLFSSEKPAPAEVAAPVTNTAAMIAVLPGTYTIATSTSVVHWAGKKPLIPDYVDSGTMALKSGTITAGTSTASGSFTLDMTGLRVGQTAKADKESALEEHLKSDDFFDVAKYPTATFTIKKVVPHADAGTTFMYDVTGDLTMHGKTNEVTFAAKIFSAATALHTQASFTIDRTKWALKYGSGSFFSNLGDKVIADEVELSLDLTATPTTPASSATGEVQATY